MARLNPFLQSPNSFTFEAGQVIFQRGDRSDFMYGILQGLVEIRVDDQVIETIGDGAVFGEMALIDEEPRSATAVAKTACRVVQVDPPAFHELITHHPAFALEVMRLMSHRLRRQLDQKAEHNVRREPAVFTDEAMRARLAQAKTYTLVVLHKTAKMAEPGARALVWEHGRRNMQLQADGLMPVVFPVGDDTALAGVGVFVGTPEAVHIILDGDPAISAGLFNYEIHPCRGFPGSVLP